ncbi:MAG TPA: hypothetical protein VFP43_19535, partial [Mesorhizobium sp.]|nr:hypothetical protein [Mesorhizobium sp.]
GTDLLALSLDRMALTSTFPSPLAGEGGSARSAETDEGCWAEHGFGEGNELNNWYPILTHRVSSSTPHPTSPFGSATFSHTGRREDVAICDNVRLTFPTG